mmetsp:Transcript_23183/g.59583  ORF Transcript_23183/g.59583 Transcript_23183/m.59583 type:complete len:301 (+) Transcript_23183:517-1419(+)
MLKRVVDVRHLNGSHHFRPRFRTNVRQAGTGPNATEEQVPLVDPENDQDDVENSVAVDEDTRPAAPNRKPRQRNEAVHKERSWLNSALDWVSARMRSVRVCFPARGAESAAGQHETVAEGSSPQEVDESMAQTSRAACALVCADSQCSGTAHEVVVECKECGQARCGVHDELAHMFMHQHQRFMVGCSMPARCLQPEDVLVVPVVPELESASDGNGLRGAIGGVRLAPPRALPTPIAALLAWLSFAPNTRAPSHLLSPPVRWASSQLQHCAEAAGAAGDGAHAPSLQAVRCRERQLVRAA